MKLTRKPNKINRQIVGMIVVIMLFSTAFIIIFNSCFLGDFYLYYKEKEMGSFFSVIETKADSEISFNDKFSQEMSKYCDKYSVSLLISDLECQKLIYSNTTSDHMFKHLKHIKNDHSGIDNLLKDDGKKYNIMYEKNPLNGETYLILLGIINNDRVVFIRCAVDGAINSVHSANVFLLLVSILSLILATLFGYYLVKFYTKPLFNMIEITKRISNFDFTAKYVPQVIYNELDDLGEHVNEMSTTLERAIEQLQVANDSLKRDLEIREETENMRKDFISNVSHELKTPIALIQGYAEGLQEGIMDDENSRQIYLDVILDEANKMNRLVREMLVLNQLEAGQMKADFDDFDVTNIVNGIIDSNRIYLEGQGIDFSFSNNEPCMVRADEVLVEQVFTNFMSNAIHYVMNENVIVVKYEFAKKGKVRISVFNSGNNIPKKDIKQIWDKFYKADKARSREYGGSGIGLSVVKAIMDLHHEKFGVENLPNGVEFWFELSLSKDVKLKQNS